MLIHLIISIYIRNNLNQKNMPRFLPIIFFLIFCHLSQAQAQKTADTTGYEKLRSKSGYMIATGLTFTLAGVLLTSFGASNYAMGVTSDGTIGNPSTWDHRPAGRVLLSFGVPILAGGMALFGSGIYFHKLFLAKKKLLVVSAGYLENGDVGIAMNF